MVVYIQGSGALMGALISPGRDYGDNPDAVEVGRINQAIFEKVTRQCNTAGDVFDVFEGIDECVLDDVARLNDKCCNDIMWDLNARVNQTVQRLLDDYREQVAKGVDYDPDLSDWECTRKEYNKLCQRIRLIGKKSVRRRRDHRDRHW